MRNMANRPYNMAAPDPIATRESIFGARWNSDRNPLTKKCWLMTSIGTVSTNWASAEIRVFSIPVSSSGTGSPIIGPMAIYISGTSRISDAISRCFMPFRPSSARSRRVCHSLRKSLAFPAALSAGDAPYPISVTACTMLCGFTLPSS